jgi:phosphatidylglycerol lysyltransferase
MPNGLMDFLFIKLILWGQTEGYETFSLGMAPLSGFESRSLAPLWHKIAAFIYEHSERFYNFASLREYKEKLRPSWEPCYIMYSSLLPPSQVLKNLFLLISGGSGGVKR